MSEIRLALPSIPPRSRKPRQRERLPHSIEILALLPLLCGFTVYDNLAEWQAAVDSHGVEDFESYEPVWFPHEGGQIVLDHFVLEADANGIDEWGPGGITDGDDPWGSGVSEFYSGPPLGLGFVTTLELCGGPCGPTYERAVFPEPIIGLFIDVPWTEDGYLGLLLGNQTVGFGGYDDPNYGFQGGVVFDQPLTTIGFDAEHSWAFIDTIYWSVAQPVPEPSTSILVALGLGALGAERRRRAKVGGGGRRRRARKRRPHNALRGRCEW